MKYSIHTLITVLILFVACQKNHRSDNITLPDIDISGSANGIVTLPQTVPSIVRKTFVKYTKLIAPNGKSIHFLAQDGWTEDQIMHARNVMQHILTSYSGSTYGNDKTGVANSMSDKRATMVLFNDIEGFF